MRIGERWKGRREGGKQKTQEANWKREGENQRHFKHQQQQKKKEHKERNEK
jgi:hypothetical protein